MENEYVIINKTAIQKRIEELEERKKVVELNLDLLIAVKTEINVLKQFLHQSIPLIPEIEKSFEAGNSYGYDSANMDEGYSLNFKGKEEYISYLKLNI